MNESPTERKLRTLRAKVSREETPKIADALETAIGQQDRVTDPQPAVPARLGLTKHRA